MPRHCFPSFFFLNGSFYHNYAVLSTSLSTVYWLHQDACLTVSYWSPNHEKLDMGLILNSAYQLEILVWRMMQLLEQILCCLLQEWVEFILCSLKNFENINIYEKKGTNRYWVTKGIDHSENLLVAYPKSLTLPFLWGFM